MAISENVYIMGCSEIDRQERCHTQSTAAASIAKLRAKNIDGGGRALKQISIDLPKKQKGATHPSTKKNAADESIKQATDGRRRRLDDCQP
jgi:hypothetical protein